MLHQNFFHIWDCWKDIGAHLYSMSDTKTISRTPLLTLPFVNCPSFKYSSLKACSLCTFSCLIFKLVTSTLVHAERKASLENDRLKIPYVLNVSNSFSWPKGIHYVQVPYTWRRFLEQYESRPKQTNKNPHLNHLKHLKFIRITKNSGRH